MSFSGKQIGKGAVYSINGSLLFVGYTLPGGGIISDANVEEHHSVKYLYSADGDIIGSKVSGIFYTMNITFYPIGNYGTNGIVDAYNSVFLPPVYSMIKLSGWPSTIAQYWNYNGSGRINFGQFNYANINMPLIYIPSIGNGDNLTACRNLSHRMVTV